MQIHLIAIGTKMPDWVERGFAEYAKRLSADCHFKISEIPAEKRTKTSDLKRLLEREGEKMLATIQTHHQVIALDVGGKMWNTETLATNLKTWRDAGKSLDFLIGGPDGFSTTCLARTHLRWSLSPLTLPHPLVRILVAEQLYRAFSILKGHPYHR